MNVALLHKLYARSSSELFAQLSDAIDGLPGTFYEIGTLMTDHDSLALDRLERLAERFSALSRL